MKKTVVLFLSTLALISAIGLSAQANPKKKNKYNEAKRACLTENPDLAGKKLQSCIKKKMK